MENSLARTITVPPGGQAATPTAVATAALVPIRAVVRNVGGTALALGFASTDLVNIEGATSSSFRLPAGASDIFILAPKQILYAVGVGLGGLISVSTSEALPVVSVA